MHNDNSPRHLPPDPASAVLRIGDHAPVVLYGAPAVSVDERTGEVAISIGYTSGRQDATITITTVEWTDDLLIAACAAGARGIVRNGMARRIPA